MALWHWDGGMALTDVSIIDHPVGEGRGGGGLYLDWDWVRGNLSQSC